MAGLSRGMKGDSNPDGGRKWCSLLTVDFSVKPGRLVLYVFTRYRLKPYCFPSKEAAIQVKAH